MWESFSPSFVRIGQTMWIFYQWPISKCVPFSLTQTLHITLYILKFQIYDSDSPPNTSNSVLVNEKVFAFPAVRLHRNNE